MISDGNDTSSRTAIIDAEGTDPRDRSAGLRDRHRRAAVGRAVPAAAVAGAAALQSLMQRPIPLPFPRPGGSRPRPAPPGSPGRRFPPSLPPARPPVTTPRNPNSRSTPDDRVNVAALRDITDDSGGRTEVIRDRARPGSGDRGHRRRTVEAVLHRLRVDRREGRQLALDPGRSRATAGFTCVRAEGSWRPLECEVLRAGCYVRTC